MTGFLLTQGSDRSTQFRPELLKAEWVPPSEVPGPAGPVELPGSEPEEPMPGPSEVPVEPDEVPSEPPPETRSARTTV